jgi:putative ABC transport system permease protein
VPLVLGRPLDARDTPSSPLVALVNQTLARRFWPGTSPLGRHLTFTLGDDHAIYEVVGVVADVPPIRPGAAPEPEMYWSNRQIPRPYTWVWVRTSVSPASVAAGVARALTAVDRNLSPGSFGTLPQRRDDELAAPRFASLLFATMGVVALLLSAIGTYGLLAYVVTRRQREFAIRLAVGARRLDVMRDVIGRGLTMAAAGLIAGLVVFVAFASVIAAFAPGVPPRDPLVLGAVTAVLVAAVVLACVVPAWRAARVDPSTSLAAE